MARRKESSVISGSILLNTKTCMQHANHRNRAHSRIPCTHPICQEGSDKNNEEKVARHCGGAQNPATQWRATFPEGLPDPPRASAGVEAQEKGPDEAR